MNNKGKSLFFLVVLFIVFSTICLTSETMKDYEAIDIKQSRLNVRAGTYFIKLNADADDYTLSDYTKIHMTYPKTTLNYDAQEGIDAHDLIVERGSFDKDALKQLVQLTNAHSWSLEDGSELNELYVDVKEAKDDQSFHTVTFSTPFDTATTVNVFEQEEVYLNLDELYMNQYSLLKDRLRTLSLIIIVLALLPSMMFLMLFKYMSTRAKQVFDLVEITE